MQRGDGFPDEVDEDGDVQVPYELDYINTLGLSTADLGDHSTCECDPEQAQQLQHELQKDLGHDQEDSDWFNDPDERARMCFLYQLAKRCDECIPSELLIQYEVMLDYHSILGDGNGC